MTLPADSFTTYDAIGNREDLSDLIAMISPTDTPFMSGIAGRNATATKFEWQTDALAAASDANANLEGDDATTDASTPTVRLDNQTQILDKVPRVTGTQRAVDSAGRADEMDYQIMKRTKEIKRDLESSLTANKAKVVGNNTTARVMAGIESWIATNDDFGAGGVSPAGDGTDTRTDGTQRAFAESQLKSVISACWEEGGEPDTIMVGSFNKQALSAFSGGSTRNIDATEKKLVNAVDVYVSDFGTMKVVPNRFQRARTALVLEMDRWKLATLRPLFRETLAKTGDTDRVQLIMEVSLQSSNEAASGSVNDLTTA